MPKRRRSARRRQALEQRRPSVRIERTHRLRVRGNKWIAVPLIVIGVVLYVLGNIGARSGIVFLPFDPHHVYSQVGGALLAFTGLMLL